jgi:hypothetical protein
MKKNVFCSAQFFRADFGATQNLLFELAVEEVEAKKARLKNLLERRSNLKSR